MGKNKVRLNGVTGKFNTYVFNIGASLQGNYLIGGLNVNPNATFNFTRSKNNGFTASNAVATPAKKLTNGHVSIGAAASKIFVLSNGTTVSPSIGANGVHVFRSNGGLLLINGATIGQVGFGANLTAGLDIGLPNGLFAKLSGSVGLFKDVTSYGASGQISIPLN